MQEKDVPVTVTYDEVANASYVYLTEDRNARVSKTYPCDVREVGGMINLDFDAEGRLMGIEVLDARKKLHGFLISKG